MTRIDLHPEDLLERAARGEASAAELARLEQHLAECAVCRVERGLSARAAIDSAPLRDEQLVVARLKRKVAEGLQAPPRRRRKSAAALFVVAAALVASAAAAATVVVIRNAAATRELELAPKTRVAAAKPAGAMAAPAAPTAAPEPAAAAPRSPETAASNTVDAAPKPSVVEPTSASELFSRANLARREGKAKEAARLYRTLQERFSGSSEELVSRVTLGRLLLDRLGDSRGALVQFNSYLASPGGGAMREEAMVGRALALGKLGRSAEERAAWRALLEAFPRSAHQKRAQARLEALDTPTR